MTDMKKTAKDKAPAKRKKLQLNKETLKDLNAKKEASPKGGARDVNSSGKSCRIECE